MTGNIAARIENVSHHYGKSTALDQVTIDIPGRSMVGLIGPDGVGKSTLLALIAGVRQIQQGHVTVFDGDMADSAHRKAICARIAYMPQGLGRNLYPTLSVFENIDFFGRLFGQPEKERHERIEILLKATDLFPFMERPAAKLSGGMKQKLSLCCALIHDPDLLILDEPTTGVDPLSRGQFWDLINRMRQRRPQMNVIIATAYMDEAARFDWLAAMDGGKVIATGTPKALLEQTKTQSLDAAFISLLPEQERAGHKPVVVRPRHVDENEVPAIEAEGLTRRFGNFVAVDHVSFRIGRGEIFGFLGSNGCGKSTTMKMLTGLLPATSGTARLFGRPMSSDDMEMRRNTGYMSQSFSLYSELTVRQNLELHADLYHLPKPERGPRIQELLARYELAGVADEYPANISLGIRQRLQLAVAVLHRPALLILDEPTSGVDPIARDAFWTSLISLSRDEGVTIFLSTHFMNEAERCDRISLMHAGKVLAVGAPQELVEKRHAQSLEDAFIGYLAEAAGISTTEPVAAPDAIQPEPQETHTLQQKRQFFDPRRLWAYARRESMEILRDPIRLAFALIGPLLLMIAFGYGISFDVENLRFAAFDQDRTPESRELLEHFSGSRYFAEQTPITSLADQNLRLRSGKLALAIEIPPDFGRDLLAGRSPEVGVTIDGGMPFRAETARGYVNGVSLLYFQYLLQHSPLPTFAVMPLSIETRFRYNQSFESVNAMVPGVIMLMLILIPAVMSAIAVVREKETGSIANFRSTPTTKFEFLVGKQLPYIAIFMVSFFLLVILATTVFQVPVKGSFPTLVVATLLYVTSTTGFGQLISTFTKTQVAAVAAATIISIVPAVNFSGFLTPVSSMSTAARLLGAGVPAAWYQPISVGIFTKGLGFANLWREMAMLIGFAIIFLIAAQCFLNKQER
ncbi:ribosome-associated ATPase/putative transporter RbbA [Beijerinckia mobilis]|uniref:ribosome-associated ATPase/putative transporter RbbA n=1 Tax=Beijerinckia mobilis TaxID=231434 RepID=UPI0005591FCF|nr:ribosome-associated ATPase/putative transporter RbbA [Beijerinckia mobilis]